MATEPRSNEKKFLERARIALINAKNNSVILERLTMYNFPVNKIDEGWNLYNNTKDVWTKKIKEDAEAEQASIAYKAEFDKVEEQFKRHWKQTQMLFKKDPGTLVELGVKGRFPRSYRDFFVKAEMFYNAIKANPEVQQQLSRILLNQQVIDSSIASVQELLKLRAEYDEEEGQAQIATKAKNRALAELEEWMDDFDTIAEIAFFDEPQHLEVLGIMVRS